MVWYARIEIVLEAVRCSLLGHSMRETDLPIAVHRKAGLQIKVRRVLVRQYQVIGQDTYTVLPNDFVANTADPLDEGKRASIHPQRHKAIPPEVERAIFQATVAVRRHLPGQLPVNWLASQRRVSSLPQFALDAIFCTSICNWNR